MNKPSLWISEEYTPYDVYQHGVKKIYCTHTTQYQHLMIADTGPYGRALFLDSTLQTTERDEMFYHEPLVQVPMVLANRNEPVRDVLILGGADGGAAVQALKWRSVERVLVVDIDCHVVNACRKHLSCVHKFCWNDERADMEIENALHFVQDSNNGTYDVIVSDLTDPIKESPILELFTVEHFTNVKSRLKPGGVLALQGGPLSLIESDLFPRICRTLEEVFENVLPAQVFAPKYGSPLAIAYATDSSGELPSMKDIDNTFETKLKGELEILDGKAFHGLFGVPKCVRKAIKETRRPFKKNDITHYY